MKTLRCTFFIGSIALIFQSCNQGSITQADIDKALNDGKKQGYDSAMAKISISAAPISKDDRPYAHIHVDGLRMSSDGSSVESGTLVFVDATIAGTGHMHQPLAYYNFINNTNLSEADLKSMGLMAPGNGKSLLLENIDLPLIDPLTGNELGTKVRVGFNLSIK